MRIDALLVSSALVSAVAAADVTVELDTGLLPSAQPGWRYEAFAVDTGTPESAVFSTDGTVLTSDSMGLTFSSVTAGSTLAIYDLAPGQIAADSVVDMRLTARVLASEVAVFHYGFSVGVYGDGLGMSAGFSPGVLSLDAAQNIAFDATGWNDYRWVGDWAAGTYTVYVNDQPLATRSLSATSQSYAALGDGTGTANARAEVAHFSVRIVPAPATLALPALLGLSASRRRR